MALATQSPKLQLVGGQLGSQARLQAAAEHAFVHPSSSITLALFYGRRPSQIEIESNTFIIECAREKSSTSQSAKTGQLAGIWNLSGFIQVAQRSHFYRSQFDDPMAGREGQKAPIDEAKLIPTSEQDLFHAVFPRHMEITPKAVDAISLISDAAIAQAGGCGITWGMVSFARHSSFSTNDLFRSRGPLPITVRGYKGKPRDFSIVSFADPFCYYITVGDWEDEPTANLTLYRGAEKGLARPPYQITPHRLRLRMNPLIPSQLGV